MNTQLKNATKIGIALLAFAALCACDDGDSGDSGSTAPATSGSTSGSSSGGTSGSGSASNATNSPPPLPTAPSTAQMAATWVAPRETQAIGDVQYSFTLAADGSVIYATSTYGQLFVLGSPTDGAVMEHTTGTWILAGLNLVLSSPVPAMNGTGEVQPLTRTWDAMQVEINGRTYRKQ